MPMVIWVWLFTGKNVEEILASEFKKKTALGVYESESGWGAAPWKKLPGKGAALALICCIEKEHAHHLVSISERRSRGTVSPRVE